jgi:hypothetical protein
MLHQLLPHPDCPPPHKVVLTAEWQWNGADRLVIQTHVADPEGLILWPASGDGRTDGLWRQTCFEAFVGSTSSPSYAEFNFSPSGAWAAYAFNGYRAGMRDLELPIDPHVTGKGKIWTATLDLSAIPDLLGPAPWRLAVTAVIEARDGAKSYWSLAHPAGAPDFHHPDCFAAQLG